MQLRILRIADVPRTHRAGMSGFMLSSAAEIERSGHQVCFWFRDQLVPGIGTPGARRLFVPWLILMKIVSASVRGERYDIAEIHEPLSAPYALAAALLPGRLPACAVLSYGLEERGWSAQRAYGRANGRQPPLRSRILVPLTLVSQARAGLRRAAVVLVPSTADRDFLVEHAGLPAERVGQAFSGVTEELFSVDHSPSASMRVLFLGSWIERKGKRELLEAWRRVASNHPDAGLTLAGVGNGAGARADTRGLAGVAVIDTVSRSDLPALFAEHDVFVLPSIFEGMPLSMLEAAAAGLACVVSSVCGNLDVFRPPDPEADGALLVPPGDAPALHSALMKLAEDSELRRVLGVRARARARRFTWVASAEQTLDAYGAAVKRRGARARTKPLKQTVKEAVLPGGSKPRTIRAGLAQGVRMHIDFATQTRLYLGLYEIELDRHLRRILRPGVTAFDVGAQHGYDSLAIAKRTGASVAAFECDPVCLTGMRRSVGLNPRLAALIEPIEATVGSDESSLGLDDWAFNGGFVPDFIKIDIEGAELDALKSATRILRQRRPALIVEVHSKSLERETGELLVRFGYRPLVVSQRRFGRDHRPTTHNRWLVAV